MFSTESCEEAKKPEQFQALGTLASAIPVQRANQLT